MQGPRFDPWPGTWIPRATTKTWCSLINKLIKRLPSKEKKKVIRLIVQNLDIAESPKYKTWSCKSITCPSTRDNHSQCFLPVLFLYTYLLFIRFGECCVLLSPPTFIFVSIYIPTFFKCGFNFNTVLIGNLLLPHGSHLQYSQFFIILNDLVENVFLYILKLFPLHLHQNNQLGLPWGSNG